MRAKKYRECTEDPPRAAAWRPGGAKWGFLRDGQKYANLETQVQQGDEYTKQEAEYVDLLAEIREILLTLVFNHHGSLQSFLAELKQVRLNVNQDLIPKMAAAGHMAE
eukprot:COSAG01_NODE_45662_length_407_cov_1.012987_1_plen_107_part_01